MAESIIQESPLQIIFDNSADIIALISVEPGPRYRYTAVNNSFLICADLRKADIEGKYVEEIIPEHSRAYILDRYQQTIEKRKPLQWEDIFENATGRRTSILTVNPLFNDEGECTMLISTTCDITNRRKSEEENNIRHLLKERVKELTTLYGACQILQDEIRPVSIVLQELVAILPAGWQYPNVTEARIIAGNKQFATSGFMDAVESQSANFSITSVESGSVEVAYIKKMPTEVEGPFLLEERNLINMLAELLSNYFTRKRVKEEWIKEKELSEIIINNLPGLFYVFDEKGKYLRWNKNHETISGYSTGEMQCMIPVNFIAKEDRELVKSKIESVFEKGFADVEAHFLTKTGEKIPYYFNGIRMESEGKPCLVGMGFDLTELKGLEQEIRDQKVQEQKKLIRAVLNAQESERNLIGRELHDNVNQILIGAKLYLGLISKERPATHDLIAQSINLVDNAIDEIRALTRREVTPPRKISLKNIIQSLVDNTREHSSVKTEFIYAADFVEINDDLKLNIYRIVQEAFNNVLKHAEASNVTLIVEAENDELRVLIKDNGKGFDPSVTNSAGIGLDNMLNRVESYNGRFTIDGNPDDGCKIEISIPLSVQI
ncbi:MAG TPA: PAS domain S-box protein [Chitinophagaceae bacterium]